MRLLIYICSSILALFLFYSCGKIELPASEDANNEQSSGITDMPHMTIAEASALPEGSHVVITAYIVGYVKGNSLSGAVFSQSDDMENTNILIADNAAETDVSKTMPIRLEKGSKERQALNMQEHPEILHRIVTIEGVLEEYFGVLGIKNVKAFELGGNAPEPNPDVPDPNDGGDSDDKSTPGISQTPEFIPQGR